MLQGNLGWEMAQRGWGREGGGWGRAARVSHHVRAEEFPLLWGCLAEKKGEALRLLGMNNSREARDEKRYPVAASYKQTLWQSGGEGGTCRGDRGTPGHASATSCLL